MSTIISKKTLANSILAQRFEAEVTPIKTDPSDLLDAFNNYFKPVCNDIAVLLGIESFKGGFDEMLLLYKYILGIDTSTDEGKKKMLDAHTLAIRWEAADAYCKHESEKLRWKPAEWWKFCWQQEDAIT